MAQVATHTSRLRSLRVFITTLFSASQLHTLSLQASCSQCATSTKKKACLLFILSSLFFLLEVAFHPQAPHLKKKNILVCYPFQFFFFFGVVCKIAQYHTGSLYSQSVQPTRRHWHWNRYQTLCNVRSFACVGPCVVLMALVIKH